MFPLTHHRYHVGESMVPSLKHFMEFIGVLLEFEGHGFRVKVSLLCDGTAWRVFIFCTERRNIQVQQQATRMYVITLCPTRRLLKGE